MGDAIPMQQIEARALFNTTANYLSVKIVLRGNPGLSCVIVLSSHYDLRAGYSDQHCFTCPEAGCVDQAGLGQSGLFRWPLCPGLTAPGV